MANPKKLARVVGANLRLWRTRKGVSQQAVARHLGLAEHSGYQSVCRWEAGQRLPSVLQLLSVCSLLGVRPSQLLETDS
jgi:transcriptional regulator with XRE-family HTH domain